MTKVELRLKNTVCSYLGKIRLENWVKVTYWYE